MNDYKEVIYIILMFVYLLHRFFKKKTQQQQPNQQPQPAAPAPGKKEKSLLETILEEVERQKELSKPVAESKPVPQVRQKTEMKQKTQKGFDFRKKAPAKKKHAPRSLEWESMEQTDKIDFIEKEEGVSAISSKMKQVVLAAEPEQRRLEFNPREAFMLKTLLERPNY